MTAIRHACELTTDRYIWTLSGSFDVEDAAKLCQAIEERPETRDFIVVDMRSLERCSRPARRMLVMAHRLWAERAHKIAYLASEARIRGLSLWIMHMAGDENAKAVGTDVQLEAWLRDDLGRQGRAFRALDAEPPERTPARLEKLGLGQRLVARAMVWGMRFAVGEPDEWAAEIVRVHGVSGIKYWSDTVQRATDRMSGIYGDLHAQTLFGLSSMWNGCRSCSRGHILSAAILYYEATQRLFPLVANDVLAWQKLDDRVAAAQVLARFDGHEDLAELRALLIRYFRFRADELSSKSEDAQLFTQIDAIWTLVNECSIVARFTDDIGTPRMPKLYRKRRVIAAYHKALAEAQTAAS